MFETTVERKKYIKSYPATFRRVQKEFLNNAVLIVEGDAKLRVPYITHRLQNSITSNVSGDKGTIGTNVEYAPYVEFGTVRTRAKPYLRPALDLNKGKLLQLYGKIFTRYFSGK